MRIALSPRRARWAAAGLLAATAVPVAACGATSSPQDSVAVVTPITTITTSPTSSALEPMTATTTVPCSLSGRSGTIPVDEVCSSTGAPHFDTPQAAMAYLAGAWNAGDVQEIDYVTDPNGRQELDAMATVMVNLQFNRCTANPAGDYTCYFNHDIIPSTSPTTYPNPMHYPAGEAVFTVAPARAPGWYLTNVLHCG